VDQHYKARAVVEGPDQTVVEAGDSLSGSAEGWAGWDSVASSEVGIPRMVDSWLRTGSEQGPFETFKTRCRGVPESLSLSQVTISTSQLVHDRQVVRRLYLVPMFGIMCK